MTTTRERPAADALQQPGGIWEEGVEEGSRRLDRKPLGTAATALVGGVDVMLGLAAMTVVSGAFSGLVPERTATVLGALVFGIGFVFITVGRSELFTENFLIPVGAVLERRQRVVLLIRTWGITLVANLAGLLGLGLLLAIPAVLDHSALSSAGGAADLLAGRDTGAAFASAIVAGILMTLWTWLNTAARTDLARIAVALLVGFALAAPTMNHVIVGSGEMILGILGDQSSVNWGDAGTNFLLALGGNLTGGLLFVTLTRFVQARGEQAQQARGG